MKKEIQTQKNLQHFSNIWVNITHCLHFPKKPKTKKKRKNKQENLSSEIEGRKISDIYKRSLSRRYTSTFQFFNPYFRTLALKNPNQLNTIGESRTPKRIRSATNRLVDVEFQTANTHKGRSKKS